jgi:HK97 family phage major capsid protein
MNPKELREKINKLGTDMKGLVDKAKAETRELSADEEREFDRMDTEREKLLGQERRALRAEELEQPDERRGRPIEQPGGPRQSDRRGALTPAEQFEGLRAWLIAGAGVPLTPHQRALGERLGMRPESKQFQLRMTPNAMRSTRPEDIKAWEERALSTITTTSPEDGSYLIANEAMRPLERALLDFGGVRQVATVLRTSTGSTLPIPTSDDTSNKGALLAENTQAVEKDTEFGQLVLNAYKFSSKKVLVSLELLQDSAINLAEFLGTALGERIGRITNDYFTTGTGTNEPKGIVTAATSSGTALGAQTPTYAELVAIQHSVDPAYRVGGRWMFADSMLAEIKKIVDASTGRPIWLPNMVGGAPDTILGDPYTVNQSMAAAAGSGSGKSILYGQLSKYIVRDVMDITLLRLDELYAEYAQVAFLAFSRHDGDLLDAGTHPVKYAANHS